MVQGALSGRFTDDVVARFDIVGFDPRGVGLSEPEFACGDLGEQHSLLASIELPIDTAQEIAAGEAAANLCIESMWPVGGLLHSAYVARDMDEIRKALGADQISYLGYSYGSALGVWYATLFPESVRAMVVDAAANPVDEATTIEERIAESIERSRPSEEILERALKACADPECPIYNDGDPVGYYLEAAAKLDLVNSAAGGYPIAGSLGVISALYAEELWPVLWQGLFELNENDDPAILLELAMRQSAVREPGASFTGHVNCLDAWALDPEEDRATYLEKLATVRAAIEGMFPLTEAASRPYLDICLFYDQFAPPPLEGPFDGGGVPILVVGNHSDPVTPFVESEELATETLSNGYLVETSHPTHTVYPANECVNNHVHRALIDRVYPSEGRVYCERE
jgi:pimeloyl-ACP methyl ester carboxylesterase